MQIAESLRDEVSIPMTMELYEILVRSHAADPAGLIKSISELGERARRLGLAGSAALGEHLLAYLHHTADDLNRAASALIRSSEMSRAADPITIASTIANTGRCLLLIQRDVPRARSLLMEAQALVGSSGPEILELTLGLGFLHAHMGEHAACHRGARACP